jgi:hypothetical protein
VYRTVISDFPKPYHRGENETSNCIGEKIEFFNFFENPCKPNGTFLNLKLSKVVKFSKLYRLAGVNSKLKVVVYPTYMKIVLFFQTVTLSPLQKHFRCHKFSVVFQYLFQYLQLSSQALLLLYRLIYNIIQIHSREQGSSFGEKLLHIATSVTIEPFVFSKTDFGNEVDLFFIPNSLHKKCFWDDILYCDVQL